MKTRIPEYRAEPVKTLAEQRGELLAELEGLIGKAKGETRAFTEEESARVSAIEKEIEGLNGTIEAERRAEEVRAKINGEKADKPAPSGQEGQPEDGEKRAVMAYIRKQTGGSGELRAGEKNLTMGDNGAIIPTSIAGQVISTVKEMCPILNGATMFSVKGTLKVPVWGDNNGHNITVGYQEEFSELTADSGKFTSVDLTGYLCGALTLIGKSVINNSDIDVFGFIVNEMSRKIAEFYERELLIGTSGKAQGALDTTTTLSAAGTSAVTADELIELQAKVPTAYQGNACWTMNPATFTSLKKLKDAMGQYLLIQNTGNLSNAFPYLLLGKPVYLSDNMPTMAAGAKSILYGDYSGLGVNWRQQLEMQVLNEIYSNQHAVGINAWFEFDSKVIDHQKLAVLVQKTGA